MMISHIWTHLVLLIFLSIIACGSSISTIDPCRDVVNLQLQILQDIQSSTNGQNWSTSWNLSNSSNFCHFQGIVCEYEPCPTIVGLFLQKFNLQGTLPKTISNLTSLISLSVSDNNGLKGNLPQLLMSTLVDLDIAETRLSGSISFPPETCGNLSFFQAYDTQISNIDLSSCQKLDTVLLANSRISGFPSSQIKVDFSQFTLLRQIDLSNTGLGNDLFDINSLCDLRLLEFVELSHNDLSGSIPRCISTLPNLQTLLLSTNSFTIFPDGPFPSLTYLDLEHNRIEGILSERYFPVLTSGWFGYNNFTGLVPVYAGPLVTELGFQNNQFVGSLQQPWWPVQFLDLRQNPHIKYDNILEWASPSTSEYLFSNSRFCPILVSPINNPRRLPFRLYPGDQFYNSSSVTCLKTISQN